MRSQSQNCAVTGKRPRYGVVGNNSCLVSTFTNHPPPNGWMALGGWILRLLAPAEAGAKAQDWTPTMLPASSRPPSWFENQLPITGHNAPTQSLSSTQENRSPGRTLQTLRRRGRPCEREGFPLWLGASRRVPSPIACLAGGRVRRPVAGFVLRVKASRSAVPVRAQALAL